MKSQYLVELSEKFFSDDTGNKSQLNRLIKTIDELTSTKHPELVILVYEYELLKSSGFGLRIFELSIFGFELWTLTFGHWILDFGFWNSGQGFRKVQSPWPLGYGLCVFGFEPWTLGFRVLI